MRKIIGSLKEKELTVWATDQVSYFTNDLADDEEGDGEVVLIIRRNNGEIYTSFSLKDTLAQTKHWLDYVRKADNLNIWQMNQLFGFDGASKNLPKHVRALVKHWQAPNLQLAS